jgi:hypothetical protein
MDAPTNDQQSDPVEMEPTSAEIETWAEKERQRRQAWLSGPSEEERAAFIRRERARRVAGHESLEFRAAYFARRGRRYSRDTQLAAEGAASLLLRWSRRSLAELIRAGRAWEAEATHPHGPRRVRLDDEER